MHKFEFGKMCVSVLSIWGKGWKLYDLVTQEFFVSRDLKFHEKVFLYADVSSESLLSHNSLGMGEDVCGGDDDIDHWHLEVHESNMVEEEMAAECTKVNETNEGLIGQRGMDVEATRDALYG